jgi:hypothetical protein
MKFRTAIAATLLSVPGITVWSQVVFGDEPEFQFLKVAEWLDERAPHGILLVQSESSADVTQPTDAGAGFDQFAALRSNEPQTGRRLDLSTLQKPDFTTQKNSTINTPAQAEYQEALTGRVTTGIVQTAPVDIIPASSFSLANLPSAAETITEASPAQTVKARRQSPISFDPRVRGYYGSQVYTTFDGGYQTPIRRDLDGILSKVDQSLIGSTEVISGPYGLRYGSGFAFINIDSIPTPRYEDGLENHLRLGTQVRGNGGQTYNTATLLGGAENAGYYANVGFRKGSDYKSGDNLAIPSSYEVLNLFSAFSYDIDDATTLETRFSYLDQGPTEYPAQFFDVSDLKYYGINQSIVHRDEQTGFGYRIDGYYSDSDFTGDTNGSGKRRFDFPVLQRVDTALRDAFPGSSSLARFIGNVNGDLEIAGMRAGLSQEYNQDTSLAAGLDFRYVQQRIRENYDITQFNGAGPVDGLFSTGLPASETFDPGLYSEFTFGVTEDWRVAMGARVAFVSTQADADDVLDVSNFRDSTGAISRDIDVSDTLASFYLTNDFDLTENYSARVGAGYAERVPDLTDRYSDGLFLAVIQSGFSRVIGNPELAKERNWQVDARVDGDFDFVRTRASVFHSWILDYITYTANEIGDPLGARLLQTINTDYATLAGFEAYAEADLVDNLQCFSGISYLDGRDREIDQPLAGISPLEGRIGMRWTELTDDNAYGVEWGWRIVDNQDRLGTMRPVPNSGSTDPIRLETETPGFATSYIRGYLRPSQRVSITGGIENLFDRNYFEHLNLRLPEDGGFDETIVFSPGITPYVGIEVEY